ncbi:hypothetical protein [Sulfurirhabdus autotrophica]|uniref:Uncharacterized protein n=1 Tax=Sulfurirhabdus autotrophica TaxID=1706046 RepID=A0A4R3XPL4_9PROT|nr:hypothetical protein [Sulfurirhabdus autotrophica]TCV78213.1 hypothetical protein EDC63_1432 [Sulfurirhabdus autotrophica]
MNPTLAERFIAENGAAVVVDGVTVVNMYRRPVKHEQKIALHVLSAVQQPIQGLRIKLSEGTIRINNQDLKEVVVWLDTAPPDLEFLCNPKNGSSSELRVWNCWRDSNGVMQAWLGNAGIVAEETAKSVTLRCSTGTGVFDPSQLRVELQFM